MVKIKSKIDKNFYALKKINIFKISSVECDNLRTEINMHKKLSHPNIIKFIDCM